MFLLTCLFIVLQLVRFDNAAAIIRNTDVSEILADTQISYYLVHQLNNLPFSETEIELSDVEDFIRSDAVSNEIGDVVDRYARALSRGDLDYHLTADDISAITRNLEPELQELFDHQLTDADHERLARTLDDIVDFESFSVGEAVEELGLDAAVPFLSISPYLLWGVGLLCLVILLLIFLHHRGNLADAFGCAGKPIMYSGFLFLLIWVIVEFYPGVFGTRFESIAEFASGLTTLVFRYGFAIALLGAASVVIGVILRRRRAY